MNLSRRILLPVVAAALGYFVDLYDIVLFGVVRVSSLTELGYTGADNTAWGIRLLNTQMIGLLLGGFFWGLIGDTRGRRTALLATITLYSLANIANAFVTDIHSYAALRFLAGFGLAGELGAGITLIAELLPAQRRGYGTTVVAFLGLCGALTAALVGGLLPWRMAYLVGGVMGLAVLALRWRVVMESPLFVPNQVSMSRGLRLLFGRPKLLGRFLAVTLVAVPIWSLSALFVNLAPEFGKALGFAAPLKVHAVLLWQASGLALGSALAGVASEQLRSRRKVIALSLLAIAVLTPVLLTQTDAAGWCLVMALIGLAQGYWAVYVTFAAEQFGTDLRATVATAAPNLVRAAVVPTTLGVQALVPTLGWLYSSELVLATVLPLALLALWRLRETYGVTLDFREANSTRA